jgi:hypothetical protein
MFACGEVFKEEVARRIGQNAYGRILDGNGNKGEMLACLSMNDMSVNIGIGGAALCKSRLVRAYTKSYNEGYDK